MNARHQLKPFGVGSLSLRKPQKARAEAEMTLRKSTSSAASIGIWTALSEHYWKGLASRNTRDLAQRDISP
jgi:hypothetical protein